MMKGGACHTDAALKDSMLRASSGCLLAGEVPDMEESAVLCLLIPGHKC